MKNIGDSFRRLVDDNFINIDGILVQKGVNSNGQNGYMWKEEWYEDVDAVRKVIKGIYSNINNSILTNDH